MSSVKKVTTLLDLDLSDIPREERAVAKKEVGDFIINEILRHTAIGTSPVRGEGKFRRLTKPYAEAEKQGDRTANLQLDGDLIDAHKSINRRGSTIEVGVTGKEAPKADGHNQISGEAKSWAQRTGRTKYRRRTIPDDNVGQKFNRKITTGINEILDTFRITEDDTETIEPEISSATTTVSPEGIPTTTVTIDNVFSDDAISELLRDALDRG